MEFFRRYLRQHRLAILLFILSWGLLAAGFALYGLPLAAVAYPALLSLLLCLAAAAWDYIRTLRRHRKLSELQTAANAQLMDLPDPASIGEADCMAAIAALRRAASEQVLSNALKYTPEGGSITIDAAAPATLCIRDTGIGITAEDLPRIFDRGYTGRNGRTYRQASGIGLYLCRRICRDLGHTITASSAAGEGTVLRLDLSRRTGPLE